MATEENTTERWLPVVGFETSHEVSDMGRIRSKTRCLFNGKTRRGHPHKPQIDVDGYAHVVFHVGGKRSSHLVHRLVLAAFVRPPVDGEQANHINFDRSDNRSENLEWCSPSQNLLHSTRAGRMARGEHRIVSYPLRQRPKRTTSPS